MIFMLALVGWVAFIVLLLVLIRLRVPTRLSINLAVGLSWGIPLVAGLSMSDDWAIMEALEGSLTYSLLFSCLVMPSLILFSAVMADSSTVITLKLAARQGGVKLDELRVRIVGQDLVSERTQSMSESALVSNRSGAPKVSLLGRIILAAARAFELVVGGSR